MNHVRSQFSTWGTVIDIDISSVIASEVDLNVGLKKVIEFCNRVDEDFSTYIDSSWITRLRQGKVAIEDCPASVQEVWQLCERGKSLSDGAFDPWAVVGGFDPSGLVKGWAADICADMLVAAGAQHVQVNAAGDLSLRGGWFDPSDSTVKPWKIGVVNPDNRHEVLKIFEITDGAIATSGTYERGAHITDPYTGMIAIGAKSATIVGDAGWLCDALATAVMVAGVDAAPWFTQSELSGYQVWAIDRHENTSWSI
jgi:thiamine biosynthesis lipoprotein